MTTDTCVHCQKKEIEHGNGWRSVTCSACAAIAREDFDWNQERIKAYNRKEITIEELRAGYRNRIKEMYYSTAPQGA
jgi:ferredoxin